MPPAPPPGSEEGLATPGWGTVGSPLCPQACCAGMENGYQSPRKRPKRAGRTLPPVKMIPTPTPVLETCLLQFFSVSLASRCSSVPWEAPPSWLPVLPTPRVPTSPRTCVPRALSGLIPTLGALCSPASPPGGVPPIIKGSPGVAGVFWVRGLFSSIPIAPALSVPCTVGTGQHGISSGPIPFFGSSSSEGLVSVRGSEESQGPMT